MIEKIVRETEDKVEIEINENGVTVMTATFNKQESVETTYYLELIDELFSTDDDEEDDEFEAIAETFEMKLLDPLVRAEVAQVMATIFTVTDEEQLMNEMIWIAPLVDDVYNDDEYGTQHHSA